MTTWHTGQAWRVVNALNKLNEAIRAYAPRSVPPATDVDSWGALADDAHSTSSDHYPHFYSALGSTAVVCARDFPHAPALGLDGAVVSEHLRALHDPRLRYIIFNRRIAEASNGWAWRAYTGDDPHDTHFHVSSARTAVADSTAAWSLPGIAAAAQTHSGASMDVITVTNIPAGTLDATGTPNTNGGQYLATPRGLLSLSGNEFFSQSVDAQNARMTMTYPRAVVYCKLLSQEPIDVEALAVDLAAQFPQGSITAQVILDAIQSQAGHDAFVAYAAEGANKAEDS